MSDFIILGIVHMEPAHAYKIRKIVQEKFGVALYPGNFYPKLIRLEKNGIIEGKWITEDHRKKKVYNLTTYGEKLFKHFVDNCLTVMSDILKRLE
jgi:DNA-binding PadR family transcriptional regulator